MKDDYDDKLAEACTAVMCATIKHCPTPAQAIHVLALTIAALVGSTARESRGAKRDTTNVVPFTEAEIERSQRRLEALFGFKPGGEQS